MIKYAKTGEVSTKPPAPIRARVKVASLHNTSSVSSAWFMALSHPFPHAVPRQPVLSDLFTLGLQLHEQSILTTEQQRPKD